MPQKNFSTSYIVYTSVSIQGKKNVVMDVGVEKPENKFR